MRKDVAQITLLGFAFRVSDDDAVQTKPYLQIPLQCFNQSGCGFKQKL